MASITYNDCPLVQIIISVYVNDNGDLVYNNDYDPELVLTLDNNGDLIVDGPNANKYTINSNGDLIFTIN